MSASENDDRAGSVQTDAGLYAWVMDGAANVDEPDYPGAGQGDDPLVRPGAVRGAFGPGPKRRRTVISPAETHVRAGFYELLSHAAPDQPGSQAHSPWATLPCVQTGGAV
ncbi:MAG TPA: hypothetical protein VME40_10915 [Caulobacteraceae bacterium]|nr:hypothetical protein [Caulobacteraceae bacterium]